MKSFIRCALYIFRNVFAAVLMVLGLLVAFGGILFFYMESDLLLSVSLLISGCILFASFKAMKLEKTNA